MLHGTDECLPEPYTALHVVPHTDTHMKPHADKLGFYAHSPFHHESFLLHAHLHGVEQICHETEKVTHDTKSMGWEWNEDGLHAHVHAPTYTMQPMRAYGGE